MSYLGLDVGTSGVKVTVVARSGAVVARAYREYNLRFPRPGWIEIRPDDVRAAVFEVIRAAAHHTVEEIEAIATASFGEAVALIGKGGEAVCDSIFYTDARGTEELAYIRARVDPAALEMRTGMPINAMYTLPKLLWLKRIRPDVLDQTRMILPYGSFVEYLLTGEAATDSSLASRTLLFNRETRSWDAELCAAFGIEPGMLPVHIPAGTPIARIMPKLAEEFGLSKNTIVVSGVHDQIAAALGAGTLSAGDVADGIGSSECLIAPLPASPNLRGMFAHNICAEPHAVPGESVALAFTSTAGAALKWFRDQFEPELAAKCKTQGISAYDVLNSCLSEAPTSLLFLPHLAGSGTPHMDACATGMISGLTLSSTKADLYRAIYEGLNFEILMNLEMLQNTGFAIERITACGGGASEASLKIKADILNAPIWMLENAESGTVGLAMLSGVALGHFASFEQAAEALVRRVKCIEPRSAYRSEYQEKYEQYSRMFSSCRAIYGR